MAVRKTLFPVILITIVVLLIVRQLTDWAVQPIHIWQITDFISIDARDARIIWQLGVPCMSPGYTTPQGAIAVKNSRVLFHNSCNGFDGTFVAIDTNSGEVTWTYPNTSNNAYQVVASKEGFLVVFGETYIRSLSSDGRQIWLSDKFFPRAMRAIFPEDDLIYAPYETQTEKLIYVVSLDSGKIVDSITEKDVIAVFNDVTIIAAEYDSTAHVIGKSDPKVDWYLKNPESVSLPFTKFLRFDDILIVSYMPDETSAFNIYSGEELWTIHHDFASAPLILGDMLLTYNRDNWLQFIDIRSGAILGSIEFQRGQDAGSNHDVVLAAEGNFLAIGFKSTDELIGVSLNLSGQASK